MLVDNASVHLQHNNYYYIFVLKFLTIQTQIEVVDKICGGKENDW